MAQWPVTTTDRDDEVTPSDIGTYDIDIDEFLAVIRQPLVYPAPLEDKALEDQ